MPHITFYLDFVSPYAWLAFAQLPQTLEGLSHSVAYRPVLLGALLQQHNNPGPAGIPPKRQWTYRHASWLGHDRGVGLDMPARHPFNPLPLLRLSLTCSGDGSINRYVAETVLRHTWQGGHDALDAQRLDVLAQALAPRVVPGGQEPDHARKLLRTNTDVAVKAGVFRVPTVEFDGRLFWGLDSLPMLRACVEGDKWFDQNWKTCYERPSGLPG